MSDVDIFSSSLSDEEILFGHFNGDATAYFSALVRHGNRRPPPSQALLARRREFHRWRTMHRRCYDQNAEGYKYYGQKGVSVCDRWGRFENFFEDMGVCPGDGYSLDRIDPYGNYEPGNCRWATAAEQAKNKRLKPVKPVKHVKQVESKEPRVPSGSVSFVENRWRALVRVGGKSASKRFAERSDAVVWAEATAKEMWQATAYG